MAECSEFDFVLMDDRQHDIVNAETANREVGQLKKLDATNPGKYELMIITTNETGNIPLEHNVIRIIKLQDFLLSN